MDMCHRFCCLYWNSASIGSSWGFTINFSTVFRSIRFAQEEASAIFVFIRTEKKERRKMLLKIEWIRTMSRSVDELFAWLESRVFYYSSNNDVKSPKIWESKIPLNCVKRMRWRISFDLHTWFSLWIILRITNKFIRPFALLLISIFQVRVMLRWIENPSHRPSLWRQLICERWIEGYLQIWSINGEQ